MGRGALPQSSSLFMPVSIRQHKRWFCVVQPPTQECDTWKLSGALYNHPWHHTYSNHPQRGPLRTGTKCSDCKEQGWMSQLEPAKEMLRSDGAELRIPFPELQVVSTFYEAPPQLRARYRNLPSPPLMPAPHSPAPGCSCIYHHQ